MSAANTTKWIGVGLLGLPLYGVLTFWSSLDPQPDPNTHYEAWAHYVSTRLRPVPYDRWGFYLRCAG